MTDLALTTPANPGIRELTDIEIDQVEGGLAVVTTIAIIAIIAIALTPVDAY